MQLKRKFDYDEGEVAESGEWPTSPGYNVVNSPLQTPVSANKEKGFGRPKSIKSVRSLPQTPVSNDGSYSNLSISIALSISSTSLAFLGSPSSNAVTPVGTCRYDSSLGDWIFIFYKFRRSILVFNQVMVSQVS